MSHFRWDIQPGIPETHPLYEIKLTPLLRQILYNRGVVSPQQVDLFLAADRRLAGDPMELPDIELALNRIYQAILTGEHVAIYGDFDTDGVSGTALLTEGLSALGLDVMPYIPSRITEGHGLNVSTLERLHKEGISLVISVDCGITAASALRRMSRTGLDTIITDHHVPLDDLPPALAVIDPKRKDSRYPFTELSGSGVALKLLQAVYQGLGKELDFGATYDLVTLGTVADCVPILSENRYLVGSGISALRHTRRLGIKRLAEKARVDMDRLDTDAIAWALAPRLNAAGRMGQAIDSYRLLVTHSSTEAEDLACWLDKKNSERQEQTQQFLSKAREQALSQGGQAALVVRDPDCPRGILGLVAGRLAEEFYRPVVVVRLGETLSYGSCRSIPEFDIISAFKGLQPLLSHFGGHHQAAGFTLPTKNLERFAERFVDLADSCLRGVPLGPKVYVDSEATLEGAEREGKLLQNQLAPFGTGNPPPVFVSRRVYIADKRVVGKNGNHLMLKLRQNGTVSDAIAFGSKDHSLKAGDLVDIVYSLKLDAWQGEERIRLNIIDLDRL